jgi:PIN domain nuclease of toxin-antitoxin system
MGDGALILLDTHVALWLTLESRGLTKKSTAMLTDARRQEETIAIASITLIETARLIAHKRITIEVSLDTYMAELESRFTILPITSAVAAATTRLPASYPRDPADRIIGATALVHGAILITADQRIRKAKAVRTLW